MALSVGNYSPYSSVQNSYSKFMGTPQVPNTPQSGPIQYNQPLSSLRPQGDTTTINTMGDLSPQERIKRKADKQYETWKADQMFRGRVSGEFSADKQQALQGLNGVNYNNYQQAAGGGSSPSLSAYESFMSNPGVGGLLGGSTSTPGQRTSAWNNAIFGQNQAYQNAVGPVYQAYGMKPPTGQITSLTPW